MKLKPILTTIAAISLMATPALSQENDGLGDDMPWAAAIVGAGVLVGWILLILEDDDDGQGLPASP